MKRSFVLGVLGSFAVVLAGCPIYPSGDDAEGYQVCDNAACYVCPGPRLTTACDVMACRTSRECPVGYACSRGACVVGSTGEGGDVDASVPPPVPTTCSRPEDCGATQTCGQDNRCHADDCSVVACPGGYDCVLSGGAAKCEKPTTSPKDAGAPLCNSDAACSSLGKGARCLGGACVAPADQCNDTTQCSGGSRCVEGACTPTCSATKACPTGYTCDTARGVCTGNPSPCTSKAQCGSGTTCVGGRCVDECQSGDRCGADLVCVGGGCIPDQTAKFACNIQGGEDGDRDTCAAGSICLRRSCYIACSLADGGADAGNACRAADQFNVCKAVSTSNGTFDVCGSASNLGSECGPTLGSCAGGKICIDGTCR